MVHVYTYVPSYYENLIRRTYFLLILSIIIAVLLLDDVHMYILMYVRTLCVFSNTLYVYIRESVDSLCRDGISTLIVCVHTKTSLC